MTWMFMEVTVSESGFRIRCISVSLTPEHVWLKVTLVLCSRFAASANGQTGKALCLVYVVPTVFENSYMLT